MLKGLRDWIKRKAMLCWSFVHNKKDGTINNHLKAKELDSARMEYGLTNEDLGIYEIPYGKCTTLNSNPLSLFHLIFTYIQYQEIWMALEEEYYSGNISPISRMNPMTKERVELIVTFMAKMNMLSKTLDGIAKGCK